MFNPARTHAGMWGLATAGRRREKKSVAHCSLVAHLSAVAESRVRIPAPCKYCLQPLKQQHQQVRQHQQQEK